MAPVTLSRLVSTLLLGLTLCGCDRRGRECEALRRVADGAPGVDGGPGDGKAAEQAVAEIDRIEPRTPELAGVRGDYRAALSAVAVAAQNADAATAEIAAAVRPLAEGPRLEIDVATESAALETRIGTLAEPCVAGMFAGLEAIFQRDAGAPAPRRSPPDCEKLSPILAMATRPEPQVSVAANALALAAALDGVQFSDPAMTEAAKGISALLRRLEPALSRLKVPAAELLAKAMRMSEAQEKLRRARTQVDERAGALRSACPAR